METWKNQWNQDSIRRGSRRCCTDRRCSRCWWFNRWGCWGRCGRRSRRNIWNRWRNSGGIRNSRGNSRCSRRSIWNYRRYGYRCSEYNKILLHSNGWSGKDHHTGWRWKYSFHRKIRFWWERLSDHRNKPCRRQRRWPLLFCNSRWSRDHKTGCKQCLQWSCSSIQLRTWSDADK